MLSPLHAGARRDAGRQVVQELRELSFGRLRDEDIVALLLLMKRQVGGLE